jgi:transcriptional regulator with PAS, ATPase and Fis domain
VYRVVEQAAPTAASVLIWGESGTGKELIAQTIHELSPRASFPFVAMNCAAIPETLLESEIFGHEKGAFTGAHDRRTGVFELAHRGTLFLDEIAEMQPATQVKLLRVLQERTFRRLGGRQEQSVDVRVIAATNVDPAEAVRKGKLREDLYYRLNVFAVELPPLRGRRDDIPLLVQTFLNEFNVRNGKSVRAVDQEAMYILERYPWPGNIRELRNVIERGMILAEGEFIEPRHLPPTLVARGEETLPTVTLSPGTTVDEAERRLILLTLEHTRNNKTRAAEILGISLKTLHNKLNRMKAETASGR